MASAKAAGRTAHYGTLKDAINRLAKGGTFTEFVHNDVDGGKSYDTKVNPDGTVRLSGARVNSKAGHTRAWAAAGGDFTKEELNVINKNDGEATFSMREKTKQKLEKLAQRKNIRQQTTELENKVFGEQRPNLRQQTTALESKIFGETIPDLDLQRIGKHEEAQSKNLAKTSTEAEAQLQDVLDFAGRLSPPRTRPVGTEKVFAGKPIEFVNLFPDDVSTLKGKFADIINQAPKGSSAVEIMRADFDKGADNSGRVYKKSGVMTNATEAEQEHVLKKINQLHEEDSNNPEYKGLTQDESADFTLEDSKGQQGIIDDSLADFQTKNDAYVNQSAEPDALEIDAASESSFGSGLRSSLHPTTLATGLIAGYASEKLVNLIDPDHKIDEVPREGLIGGMAGAGGAGMGAALGGTAFTAGVGLSGGIAGAGAAIVGYETSKWTTEGLEKMGVSKDVSEGVGSGIGGMAGGATFGGLAAMGTAAAEGATFGEVGGPVGMAIGATIGLGIGLGSYLIHKFS